MNDVLPILGGLKGSRQKRFSSASTCVVRCVTVPASQDMLRAGANPPAVHVLAVASQLQLRFRREDRAPAADRDGEIAGAARQCGEFR